VSHGASAGVGGDRLCLAQGSPWPLLTEAALQTPAANTSYAQYNPRCVAGCAGSSSSTRMVLEPSCCGAEMYTNILPKPVVIPLLLSCRIQ